MRVFVYEYTCGGGLAGRAMPDSLAREGWAMLASVVEDFARIAGCDVLATLDERFARRPLRASVIEVLGGGLTAPSVADSREMREIERDTIARLSVQADWTLVIAPEFDGILFDRVRWVEEAGGRLLGSPSRGVAATADKLDCARLLDEAGVASVGGRIVRVDDLYTAPLALQPPAVLKPRDGAGSQNTFLIPDASSVDRVLREVKASGLCGEALLQPFVPGLAASVSLLVGPNGPLPLLAGEQLLSTDGQFRYLGGRLPLLAEFGECAIELATRAVAAIPGLSGFVGVDLVLGPGHGFEISNLKSQISEAPRDHVIEINPRLTTSYVGLRALARCNLAQQMISIASGERVGPIEWRPESVGFSADGRLT